jgi:hypothetical protein
MILRTVATDDLLAKYPVTTDQGFIGTARRGWQFFEDKAVMARLHVTSVLLEDQGGELVRKFTQDANVIYVAKRLLDMYGVEASDLSQFIFESVEYGNAPVSKSLIRISRAIGATVGYVMPMQNIQELTF